jgi:hypothetical protein
MEVGLQAGLSLTNSRHYEAVFAKAISVRRKRLLPIAAPSFLGT